MQQRGVISGEIAFMMKPGASAITLNSPDYPGLKRVLPTGLYVVNTRTPAEFLAVLKRLQGRPDLQWVEPTVQYVAIAD
jgi:hypothetical protein